MGAHEFTKVIESLARTSQVLEEAAQSLRVAAALLDAETVPPSSPEERAA